MQSINLSLKIKTSKFFREKKKKQKNPKTFWVVKVGFNETEKGFLKLSIVNSYQESSGTSQEKDIIVTKSDTIYLKSAEGRKSIWLDTGRQRSQAESKGQEMQWEGAAALQCKPGMITLNKAA